MRCIVRRLFNFSFLIISICSGQLISIKSVPLAAGSQFSIYPSESFGMGNISIAFNDTYKDPYNNPVTGRNIHKSIIFCLPTFYTQSEQKYFNKSFPLSLLLRRNSWFAGFCLALQQVNNQPLNNRDSWQIIPETLSGHSGRNQYLHLFAGKEIRKNTTNLAWSFLMSELNAVDGIDYLYSNSARVELHGNIYDYRVGLSHCIESLHTFELLLLHHRSNITHKVIYPSWLDWSMDNAIENKDRTNTWGGHLKYLYPINKNYWQLGCIVTINYKTHPKIPNYDLMNIPRDPGNSYAYNFGIGIAKSIDSLKFGIDMIYEPIWSHTWAVATNNLHTNSDKIINPGEKTVNNDFQFNNVHLRTGLYSQGRVIGIQLGLAVSSINYRLRQNDFVLERKRRAEENWFEWNFTWGLVLKLSGFDLYYQGQVLYGLGIPGIEMQNRLMYAGEDFKSDLVVAPAGDLTLQDTAILTHRIMIAVPIE